jgi:hypothetical protein
MITFRAGKKEHGEKIPYGEGTPNMSVQQERKRKGSSLKERGFELLQQKGLQVLSKTEQVWHH